MFLIPDDDILVLDPSKGSGILGSGWKMELSSRVLLEPNPPKIAVNQPERCPTYQSLVSQAFHTLSVSPKKQGSPKNMLIKGIEKSVHFLLPSVRVDYKLPFLN